MTFVGVAESTSKSVSESKILETDALEMKNSENARIDMKPISNIAGRD